ncbi:alpha/beta fold hydrolase [Caldisericum sp.]|uniref:alpha/beta fold hydrolase n=1 Tax=Caldisericum sp. TaxID=2499687 RepID=UPI003D1180CA
MGKGENTFLLIHGFGAGTFTFGNVIREFTKFGRVVVLDLPGFGLSERPSNSENNLFDPYSRVGQVEIVRAFVAKLSLHDIILVGHSMGGGISALLAERYPELVKALVLVDPAIDSYSAPKIISNIMKSHVGKIIFLLIIKPITLSFKSAISKAYFDKSKITRKMRKSYLQTLTVTDWDKGLYYLFIADNSVDIKSGLSNISIPTLVIAGANDEIVDPASIREVAVKIPSSQYVEIEECGHLPHEEKPGEFLQSVLNYLRSANIGIV